MASQRVMQAARWSALIIFLAAAFFRQSMIGLTTFDEGFIVSGAMLILDGKLPYRDFLSMYGPGQYYLSAGVFALFSEALIFIRYLHVLLLTALGMTVYALVRSTGAGAGLRALVLLGYVSVVLFAKPNVGYPAITATLFLLLSALALRPWLRAGRIANLAYASCMIGFAGLFRWDFGAFGLLSLAATLAILFVIEARRVSPSQSVATVATVAFGPALGILAVVYVPLLVIFSDPARWYVEVPLFLLTEFQKWRNLDFLGPAYQGLFLGTARTFVSSLLRLAYLGLPIVLVIAGLATAISSLWFRRDKRDERDNLALMLYLALLSLFLLNQMRVRPSVWQGFPALVASLPLIVLLWNHYRPGFSSRRAFSMIMGVTVLAAAAMVFKVALAGRVEPARTEYLEFDTPKTAKIFIERERTPYAHLVNYVYNNTRPGEPIYSGVKDHSRLFVNDAMLYFLVDRPPADRFLELEPGISNTLSGQQEIIDALVKKNVRLIVLSEILSKEPNLTARSNGIKVLDNFIRSNYHHHKDFGSQAVFVRNE